VTETSESTETTATETSEATETAASATVTEVAETAVNTDETEVSDTDNSQSVNGNQISLSILLIVGGVVVAASYVGLFMLGRKMGRNKRGR
jgi:cobalamin biosynthesis Mg chelatase CobN